MNTAVGLCDVTSWSANELSEFSNHSDFYRMSFGIMSFGELL
jgi:hypothetical protein